MMQYTVTEDDWEHLPGVAKVMNECKPGSPGIHVPAKKGTVSEVEWSGVEWSGVECCGVECSGVECSRVQWSGVEWSGVE